MNVNESVDVSFFVPCYNEADNIAGALDTIESVARGKGLAFEIIVVDDASTDGTQAAVEAYCSRNGDAPIVFHRNRRNRGLGYNYLSWASGARGRYYMLVNGDNDISAETISTVLDLLGRADIVVPYLANQEERPLYRRVLSRTFTFLVNRLGGHRLRYYNGPVLHLRANVERFRPNTIGFAYQAELLCRALRHSCSYVEIPFRSAMWPNARTSAFHVSNIVSVLLSLVRIFLYRMAVVEPRRKGALPEVGSTEETDS